MIWLVRAIRRKVIEQFGRSEPFVSLCDSHLLFLDHVHEFNAGSRTLRRFEGLEPQHGSGHPLDGSVALFHDIISIFDLADRDRCAILLIVALDGGCIGITAVTATHPSLGYTSRRMVEILRRVKRPRDDSS